MPVILTAVFVCCGPAVDCVPCCCWHSLLLLAFPADVGIPCCCWRPDVTNVFSMPRFLLVLLAFLLTMRPSHRYRRSCWRHNCCCRRLCCCVCRVFFAGNPTIAGVPTVTDVLLCHSFCWYPCCMHPYMLNIDYVFYILEPATATRGVIDEPLTHYTALHL
jgi:hypothetical protein